MSDLDKKLDQISDLMKQFKAKIKVPKMTGIKTPKASIPKIPGLPAQSKKDPLKVAQQTPESTGLKPTAVAAAKNTKEALKTSKNGQWSLGKAGEANNQDNADGTKNED